MLASPRGHQPARLEAARIVFLFIFFAQCPSDPNGTYEISQVSPVWHQLWFGAAGGENDVIKSGVVFLKDRFLPSLLLSRGHECIPYPPPWSLLLLPLAAQLHNRSTYVMKFNSGKWWHKFCRAFCAILRFSNHGNMLCHLPLHFGEMKCAPGLQPWRFGRLNSAETPRGAAIPCYLPLLIRSLPSGSDYQERNRLRDNKNKFLSLKIMFTKKSLLSVIPGRTRLIITVDVFIIMFYMMVMGDVMLTVIANENTLRLLRTAVRSAPLSPPLDEPEGSEPVHLTPATIDSTSLKSVHCKDDLDIWSEPSRPLIVFHNWIIFSCSDLYSSIKLSSLIRSCLLLFMFSLWRLFLCLCTRLYMVVTDNEWVNEWMNELHCGWITSLSHVQVWPPEGKPQSWVRVLLHNMQQFQSKWEHASDE